MVAKRRTLTALEKLERDNSIAQRLRRAVDWSKIRTVHAYRSLEKEVDTAWLSEFIADWPDIRLTYGEAVPDAAIPSSAYDMLIIPVLAFDESLNRVGMGGGWYDRLLTRQPDALIIGLAYDMQKAEGIPVEPHDVPMTYVVTERRVYRG